LFHNWTADDFDARRRHFAEVVYRSKFVLCPRGHGTSSIRLFETLAAGRVPVIISDDWVAPDGPDWDAISLRWPEEASFAELLARLEELEPHAAEMGARGSFEFAEWFALPVLFDRVAEALADLAARRAAPQFPRHGVRGRAYGRMLVAETIGKARHRMQAIRARV
jgi:hypothetical protein